MSEKVGGEWMMAKKHRRRWSKMGEKGEGEVRHKSGENEGKGVECVGGRSRSENSGK